MKWMMLGAFLASVALVAGAGGWFTAMGVSDWYLTLNRPSWNPPSWLFGPVWTALYVAMAVAAWLVWREAGLDGATAALTLWGVQLLLNLAWSGIFFALRSPGWALVEIAALWLAILATTVLFFRYSGWAGALMVPYLAWVSFAAVLNAAIVRLN
ncbi:MAG: TspO/MBR family protein [Longimicrobiales bacterium]